MTRVRALTILLGLAACGDNLRIEGDDQPPKCGDGVRDPGEECDDGNTIDTDDCRNCAFTRCGDAVVDSDEECDVGVPGLSADGCSSACLRESATWNEYLPRTGPYLRQHAIAFDSFRNRMVAFGGFVSTGLDGPDVLSDRTWEWDGTRWNEQFPAARPPARIGHKMVYDSARKRVVLFGGSGLNDTWEYDGSTWTQMSPTSSPPPRSRMGMAYDASRGVTVIVGGTVSTPMPDLTTWEWNGVDWTAHAAAPYAFAGSAITYAGARGVIICGDQLDGCDKMWSWDGSAWTALAVQPATYTHWIIDDIRLTYDAARNRVVRIAGGSIDGHEVEEWDGSQWSVYTVPGVYLREEFAIAYDSSRNSTVLFAGAWHGSRRADTWLWNGLTWRAPDGSPAHRTQSQPAYDARRGVFVFLDDTIGETWEGNGDTWTTRSPASNPPYRQNYGIAYDEESAHTVVYGGASYRSGVEVKHDTWEWDGTDWEQRMPAHVPVGDQQPCLVFNRSRHRVMLFVPNRLYEWDGEDWIEIASTHAPDVQYLGRLAYDADRDVVVLLGKGPADEMQTWEWDGLDWTLKDSMATANWTDWIGSIVYDPQRKRVIQLDPIAREWDGNSWKHIADQPADVRFWYSAYDRIRQGVFGFNVETNFSPWLFRHESSARELCDGSDGDGDTLIGCNDPDCWGRCNPLCLPGTTCDPSDPHCGDGTCSVLESNAICPSDCP